MSRKTISSRLQSPEALARLLTAVQPDSIVCCDCTQTFEIVRQGFWRQATTLALYEHRGHLCDFGGGVRRYLPSSFEPARAARAAELAEVVTVLRPLGQRGLRLLSLLIERISSS